MDHRPVAVASSSGADSPRDFKTKRGIGINHLRVLAAFAVVGSVVVQAQAAPGNVRYRVERLAPPAGIEQPCLPGYKTESAGISINDQGVVQAAFECVSHFDAAARSYQMAYSPFVGAAWLESLELQGTVPGNAWAGAINNSGTVFGAEVPDTGGFYGMRWSLAGGRERIFDDPTCGEGFHWAGAIAGNDRYTVGWGFRADPTLPPELSWACIATRWLIRTDDGGETQLDISGVPSWINAQSVAVGTMDRSAIRYAVPTAQMSLLHAGDELHRVRTTQINDLGLVAGYIINSSTPGGTSDCDPSVAVRWANDNSEQVLPHLPGGVSSRAFGVGYNGEVVGHSGAGAYCADAENGQDRATVWRGDRAIDLNTAIPPSLGITLTVAYAINRRGQIAGAGYFDDEPMQLCPSYLFGLPTEPPVLQAIPCRKTHAFVLTPVGR
jgi:uncharacterized membrane protein